MPEPDRYVFCDGQWRLCHVPAAYALAHLPYSHDLSGPSPAWGGSAEEAIRFRKRVDRNPCWRCGIVGGFWPLIDRGIPPTMTRQEAMLYRIEWWRIARLRPVKKRLRDLISRLFRGIMNRGINA